jgi:hypothetical protein
MNHLLSEEHLIPRDEYRRVAAQRNELLAALKMAREHFASYGSQDREEDNQLMDILQAAIKKAEEK